MDNSSSTAAYESSAARSYYAETAPMLLWKDDERKTVPTIQAAVPSLVHARTAA
jgi:hypothetical protein